MRMRAARAAVAVALGTGLLGTVGAATATPAGAGTPVDFAITVNGDTAAVIPDTQDATLSWSGLPGDATGTVEFDAGATILCTADLSVDTSCTTSGLTAGSYAGITATYSGDATYDPSSATNTVDLTVGASHLTCTKMAGYATVRVQITKCGFTGKGVWMSGAAAFGGGTAAWAPVAAGASFTFTASDHVVGQGDCAAGRVEHDVSGIVTASASSRVAVGDYYGFRACVFAGTNLVKLVPGTSASL